MDTLYTVLSYCKPTSIAALGAVSADLALYVLQCLKHYHVRSWRLMFPLYLRARYAVHPCANEILSGLWFAPFYSRACRVCGKQTQRRVFGTLLCASCTRNSNYKCWMVPESIAVNLFRVFVPVHSGPRCALVFAYHVQTAASFKGWAYSQSRKLLLCCVNGATSYRQ